MLKFFMENLEELSGNELVKLSDNELVNAMNNGKKEKAFTILYKKYHAEIYSFCVYFCRDENLAKDFASETFIKFLEKYETFKEKKKKGTFKSWLYKIAQNKMLDYYRKSKRNSLSFESNLNIFDEDGSENLALENFAFNNNFYNEKNIDEVIIKQEESEFLKKVVGKLSPVQKQIIYLRFWKDKQFNEIAEETNSGVNTAKGRVGYALKNLRKIVTKSSFLSK